MKRRKSSLPVRIYTYGCRLPTVGGDLVNQQLLLAHHYYNKLIEIERRRRKKVRDAQSASSQAVSQAEAAIAIYEEEIAKALSDINGKKAHARSSKVDISTEQALLDNLRALKKKRIDELKVAKKEARTSELLAIFKTIDQEALAEIREARGKCGVYWGTYLMVEKAVEAARRNREDPEFHRLAVVPNREGPIEVGHGRVGVQLMNGASVSEIVGDKDTRLQIDSPAPNKMSTVRIRVGTVEGSRSPIFAEFPFRFHRPLPADGIIKWAWIHKSLKGRWVDWKLQISVESASFEKPRRSVSDGGAVALDIGWRVRPGEGANQLRVAYWYDDQGNHGELVLPSDDQVRIDAKGRNRRPVGIRGRLDHADSLRSIEDRNFDAIRAELITWKNQSELPVWLSQALEWLASWRSPGKLGRVVDQWKNQRFIGDEVIFERLTGWWRQHRHLYDWESCERDRALGARKNLYRQWAAQLTQKYAVIVLEDFDLSEVAELQAPDSSKSNLPHPVRRNRTVASCSEFVGALKSAAPGNGCSVELVPCMDTTATCSKCGNVERFDHVPLLHTCEWCGGESGPRDQDRNAAENLLAIWAGKQGRSRIESQLLEKREDLPDPLTMPAQGGVP